MVGIYIMERVRLGVLARNRRNWSAMLKSIYIYIYVYRRKEEQAKEGVKAGVKEEVWE